MICWIKRIARILGILSFFIAFFMGIDPYDPFDVRTALNAVIKGFAGALLFWMMGFIVADIIIKGIMMSVPTEASDAIEGGLLQRLHAARSSLSGESDASAIKINPVKKNNVSSSGMAS